MVIFMFNMNLHIVYGTSEHELIYTYTSTYAMFKVGKIKNLLGRRYHRLYFVKIYFVSNVSFSLSHTLCYCLYSLCKNEDLMMLV